jgi:hypothetical protein
MPNTADRAPARFRVGEPGRAVILRLPPGEPFPVLDHRIECAVRVVGWPGSSVVEDCGRELVLDRDL